MKNWKGEIALGRWIVFPNAKIMLHPEVGGGFSQGIQHRWVMAIKRKHRRIKKVPVLLNTKSIVVPGSGTGEAIVITYEKNTSGNTPVVKYFVERVYAHENHYPVS